MWVSRWLTSEKSGLLVQILQVKGIVDGPFMMFIFDAAAAAAAALLLLLLPCMLRKPRLPFFGGGRSY